MLEHDHKADAGGVLRRQLELRLWCALQAAGGQQADWDPAIKLERAVWTQAPVGTPVALQVTQLEGCDLS
jgi:hypothetical protein